MLRPGDVMVRSGDIVRTNTWGWNESYAGQHFLVTDVTWDADHMKHVFLLQDHIGGGFIWAGEDEAVLVDRESSQE